MNRREFTGSLTAAALYASMRKAGLLPVAVSELSMAELQQQFLNLRFGMYIHLNMASMSSESGEIRRLCLCYLIRRLSTLINGTRPPAPPGWRMDALRRNIMTAFAYGPPRPAVRTVRTLRERQPG